MKRSVLILLIMLGLATSVCATDRPGPHQPWAELETMLQQEAGIKTDTASLIQWLQKKPLTPPSWLAIEILGLRGDKAAVSVLLPILANTEESRFLRETAALALARLGNKQGRAALQDFMETSDDWPRQIFLASRLAELGDPSGFPYVEKASQSKVNDVRYLSAAALVAFLPYQEISGQRIDPLGRFLGLARDDDAKIRREFLIQAPIAALKGADIATLRPLVKELADDVDPEVKQMAALVLTGWEFEESNRTRKPEGQ